MANAYLVKVQDRRHPEQIINNLALADCKADSPLLKMAELIEHVDDTVTVLTEEKRIVMTVTYHAGCSYCDPEHVDLLASLPTDQLKGQI